MELRHLRYFTVLASTLNFTRAAERLHVTQSTLSHQIRQLEEEVGRPLFERTGRRVSLTEAGDDLLQYATRALHEIDLGLSALRNADVQRTGLLRLAATHTFNLDFLPDCIADFHAKHPRVKVVVEELAADEIAERLQQGRLDLGIAYRPATPGSLHFEPLYSEEMVLVVAPSHPFAPRKRVRMAELNGEALALLPATFATRRMLDECFQSCAAQPDVLVEMNTLAPMLTLVGKTRLATIVAVGAVPPNAGLVAVRLESPTPTRTPGMLWSPESRESPLTRAFSVIVRKLAFRSSLRTTRDSLQAVAVRTARTES